MPTIQVESSLVTMTQVVDRPTCRGCGGNILRGETVWKIESKGLFKGGYYHKSCKPSFDEIQRKIPSKKARESLIRKQLREDGLCYRGTIRVSEETPGVRKYVVETLYGAGRPDTLTGCTLSYVVQLLLNEEDMAISDHPLPLGGGGRHCGVCIKRTICDKSGLLPCERFGVKPPAQPIKKSEKPKIPESSFKDLKAIAIDLRGAVEDNERFNKKLLEIASRIESILDPSQFEVYIEPSDVTEKIRAIKAIREVTHCSLKEAKDIVDGRLFHNHFAVAEKLFHSLQEMGIPATIRKLRHIE